MLVTYVTGEIFSQRKKKKNVNDGVMKKDFDFQTPIRSRMVAGWSGWSTWEDQNEGAADQD